MAQDAPTGYRAVRHRAPISERPAAASRDHRVSSHCANSEETTMSVADPQPVARPIVAAAGWTGPTTTTRSAVVDPDGEQILTGSPSPTTRPDCAPWSAAARAPGSREVGIERRDGPVVDALLAAGLIVFVIPPGPAQEPALPLRVGRQQGRPVRRLRPGRCRAHRPPPAAPLLVDSAATTALRHDRAAPAVTWSTHRVAVANQLRAHLQIVLPRRSRAVRRHRLRDQPEVPRPVRHPGPRRLALAQTAGRLAVLGRLQRPHPARHPARPAA